MYTIVIVISCSKIILLHACVFIYFKYQKWILVIIVFENRDLKNVDIKAYLPIYKTDICIQNKVGHGIFIFIINNSISFNYMILFLLLQNQKKYYLTAFYTDIVNLFNYLFLFSYFYHIIIHTFFFCFIHRFIHSFQTNSVIMQNWNKIKKKSLQEK